MTLEQPLALPTTRPRFRFSLGTLFVMVTIVAVFIAYQVNWIRERHDILAERGPVPMEFRSFESLGAAEDPFAADPAAPAPPTPPPPRAPGLLSYFGEQGYSVIRVTFGRVEGKRQRYVDRELTSTEREELERVKRLFPEAQVLGEALQPKSAAPANSKRRD